MDGQSNYIMAHMRKCTHVPDVCKPDSTKVVELHFRIILTQFRNDAGNGIKGHSCSQGKKIEMKVGKSISVESQSDSRLMMVVILHRRCARE